MTARHETRPPRRARSWRRTFRPRVTPAPARRYALHLNIEHARKQIPKVPTRAISRLAEPLAPFTDNVEDLAPSCA
eukprot:7223443-Pyramimonas_sp.AAC.1